MISVKSPNTRRDRVPTASLVSKGSFRYQGWMTSSPGVAKDTPQGSQNDPGCCQNYRLFSTRLQQSFVVEDTTTQTIKHGEAVLVPT